MLKKTMTYTDYNGEEIKEDFYFNLSRTELMRMEVSRDGGMEDFLTKIVNLKNNKEIFDAFEEIILKSYGEKSADGKRFIKSKELSKAFSEKQAYDDMIVEFMQDPKSAVDFINGLLPKEVQDEIKKRELEESAKDSDENA